nr:phage tail fiber assembly protein [uncultured Mediterranean phage uvMED]
MIYTKVKALISLKPNKQFSWTGNEYSGLTWLDSGTAPTESELDAEVTRLSNAEPMRLLRVERDRLLTACDWRASSDLTLADAWKTYRQALRDLPVSASPKIDSNGELDMTSVTFPTEPT